MDRVEAFVEEAGNTQLGMAGASRQRSSRDFIYLLKHAFELQFRSFLKEMEMPAGVKGAQNIQMENGGNTPTYLRSAE